MSGQTHVGILNLEGRRGSVSFKRVQRLQWKVGSTGLLRILDWSAHAIQRERFPVDGGFAGARNSNKVRTNYTLNVPASIVCRLESKLAFTWSSFVRYVSALSESADSTRALVGFDDLARIIHGVHACRDSS